MTNKTRGPDEFVKSGSDRIFIYTNIIKLGGLGVALRTPKPQVRGSVLELGKVDTTFHTFSGSIKLGTKHAWELNTGDPALY